MLRSVARSDFNIVRMRAKPEDRQSIPRAQSLKPRLNCLPLLREKPLAALARSAARSAIRSSRAGTQLAIVKVALAGDQGPDPLDIAHCPPGRVALSQERIFAWNDDNAWSVALREFSPSPFMIGGIGMDDPLGVTMSLARNTVELLFVSINVTLPDLARLSAVLTSAEAGRAARFLHDADRRKSIVGRAVLRCLLSRHFGVEPQGFRFELRENGKPFLPQSNIHFNVSHSGEIVAIALAANEVGVDIEARHRIPEIAAIAARFFSKEEAERVRAATDSTAEFFRIWTMKEAVVKAVGQGLGFPLDCFTVPSSAPTPRLAISVGRPPTDWFVVETEVPDGYYGAVAMLGSEWRVIARWLPVEDVAVENGRTRLQQVDDLGVWSRPLLEHPYRVIPRMRYGAGSTGCTATTLALSRAMQHSHVRTYWTPPDSTGLAKAGTKVTTADVYPAS